MVTSHGGEGIALRVDHMEADQVQDLFARVRSERNRLDILVNDVWGGDEATDFGKPFWELDPARGLAMLANAVHTHVITSRYAAPLLLDSAAIAGRPHGIIVEITDGDHYQYRGNLYYDLVKTTVIRLAFAQGYELRRRNIAAVAVTPGFLRSEAMLDLFEVTEASWRDAVARDANFIASETPFYVGRAVAALAADPLIMAKSGRVFSSWNLADEYHFTDQDGSTPHWGRHFAQAYQPYKICDEGFYAYLEGGPMAIFMPDWP